VAHFLGESQKYFCRKTFSLDLGFGPSSFPFAYMLTKIHSIKGRGRKRRKEGGEGHRKKGHRRTGRGRGVTRRRCMVHGLVCTVRIGGGHGARLVSPLSSPPCLPNSTGAYIYGARAFFGAVPIDTIITGPFITPRWGTRGTSTPRRSLLAKAKTTEAINTNTPHSFLFF
jgi:hypothetical protein